MNNKPRFGIIGAGPVGGIMGVHLANAGHEVFLVDVIKEHLDEILVNGFSLTGFHDMNARFSADRLCYSIEELGSKDVDVLFISVKTSLLNKLLPQIEKVVKPGSTIISLQNGMDTEELVAQTFGKENTLRIVVNYAGNLLAYGTVRMSFFNAPNYIGTIHPEADEKARMLAGIITEAGLETVFTEHIKKTEWEKTILNASLSPVCAITSKTMKQMMDYNETRLLVRSILEEGIEVVEANGIHFEKDFLQHCLDYLDNAGHHQTSMHVDLEAGNRTEIDFLNGKIVEYGKAKGVPTPYNSAIVSLIKGIEMSKHDEQ